MPQVERRIEVSDGKGNIVGVEVETIDIPQEEHDRRVAMESLASAAERLESAANGRGALTPVQITSELRKTQRDVANLLRLFLERWS
jgi:hypothetical protein